MKKLFGNWVTWVVAMVVVLGVIAYVGFGYIDRNRERTADDLDFGVYRVTHCEQVADGFVVKIQPIAAKNDDAVDVLLRQAFERKDPNENCPANGPVLKAHLRNSEMIRMDTLGNDNVYVFVDELRGARRVYFVQMSSELGHLPKQSTN